MADAVVEALIVDLLQWLAERDRTHEEVMNAWRTSCPRLPVWEDANDLGFVVTRQGIVSITPPGRAFLNQHSKVLE
jgi:D-3-phosphoglycerate dehydrogenase